MSWKEKRLITILSIILAVLCAAVLVVSVIYSLRNRTLVERATVAQADVQRAFIETFSGIVGVISQIMAFAPCLTAMAPQRCPSP